MKLIPFENIEIFSPLSKSEAEEAIRNNISWNPDLELLFNKGSFKDYEGFVEEAFKIRRILKSGRNSFIPVAIGKIYKDVNNHSKINIKLRLHKFVLIFAAIMTIFSSTLFFVTLLNNNPTKKTLKEYLLESSMDPELVEEVLKSVEEEPKTNKVQWISLFLSVTPYLMCTIFFNIEAVIIKDKLNSILKV